MIVCRVCNRRIESIEEVDSHRCKYIPRYKGDKKRVYCLTCKESCYPSLEGRIPESKEELDTWYNIHSSLFHKNEELIPIDISKIEKKENTIEKLYKCDICNALYREKSNIEKHLKYLHKKEVEDLEPIEIDYSKREKGKSYDYGLVIDMKSIRRV